MAMDGYNIVLFEIYEARCRRRNCFSLSLQQKVWLLLLVSLWVMLNAKIKKMNVWRFRGEVPRKFKDTKRWRKKAKIQKCRTCFQVEVKNERTGDRRGRGVSFCSSTSVTETGMNENQSSHYLNYLNRIIWIIGFCSFLWDWNNGSNTCVTKELIDDEQG